MPQHTVVPPEEGGGGGCTLDMCKGKYGDPFCGGTELNETAYRLEHCQNASASGGTGEDTCELPIYCACCLAGRAYKVGADVLLAPAGEADWRDPLIAADAARAAKVKAANDEYEQKVAELLEQCKQDVVAISSTV